MGSSSDDFGWTDTSNDDTVSEAEMHYDDESESGKSYKKKLQKELFKNGGLDESGEERKRKKKHKKNKEKERERDVASPLVEVKREKVVNGCEDSVDGEYLLKMKVKEEQVSFAVPTPKESSRKRRRASTESEQEHVSKKKKKKRLKTEEQEVSTTDLDDSAQSPRKKKRLKTEEEEERRESVSFDDSVQSPKKKNRHRTEESEPSMAEVDGPTESPRKKKKKTKDRESSINESQDSTAESPRKKKKRKRSERTSIDEKNVVIDKFEAEETVVEQRPTVNGYREEKVVSQSYPSKEFIEDDDSSDEEPSAPHTSARKVSGSDAKSESPRKARMSDRITFDTESQSEAENERAPKPSPVKSPKSKPRLSERRTSDSSDSAQVAKRTSFSDKQSPRQARVSERDERRTSENNDRAKVTKRISFSERPRASEKSDSDTSVVVSQATPIAPQPTRRLSERITFETESDSEPQATPTPQRKPSPPRSSNAARLGKFLRAHAHMQPVLGAFPPGGAITEDDDVWLLRCPSDIDAQALQGATLQLDSKSKLKVGGRAFETAPVACGDRVALLVPAQRGRGFSVRSMALSGSLRLRARLPRPQAPPPSDDASPERIPLPETRARHPLLGVSYEESSTLPPEILRRLAAASAREPNPDIDEPDSVVRTEKKKKKKKHKEREPEPESLPEPEPEPKKRKRKHSSHHEPDPSDSQREPDSPPRKKKVKKEKKEKRDKEKKRRDDPIVWDNEQDIEESLFNF